MNHCAHHPPLTLAELLREPIGTWPDVVLAARREDRLPVVTSSDHTFEQAALASLDPSGRVREPAVVALAGHRHGGELPFLLLRLNDWVQEVRTAASSAVAERMHADAARAWLDCLPLALRVTGGTRADHAWVLESVGRLLVAEGNDAVLADGLQSPETGVRRFCQRSALVHGGQAATQALRGMERSRHPNDRLLAARHWLAGADASGLRLLLAETARDHSPAVRRAVLEAAAERIPDDVRGQLLDALLAKSNPLRRMAQFHLRTTVNLAAIYRDALAEGACPVATLRGLGECGSAEDATATSAFFHDDRPAVRAAAVEATGKLHAPLHFDALMDRLRDASGSVRRAAARALLPFARQLAPHVSALYDDPGDIRARRSGLILIEKLPKWQQIVPLLRSARGSDAELATVARELLHKWVRQFNRSPLPPTDAQLTRITAELAETAPCLDGTPLLRSLRELVFWRH